MKTVLDLKKRLRDTVARSAGICAKRGGYTETDALGDLTLLSQWTGLHLVCLWDFEDGFGLGGDSEYAVAIHGKRGLHEAPKEIFDYLWHEGKNPPAPETLLGLKPGPFIKGSLQFQPSIYPDNWVRNPKRKEKEKERK